MLVLSTIHRPVPPNSQRLSPPAAVPLHIASPLPLPPPNHISLSLSLSLSKASVRVGACEACESVAD
jgi:hypothetical protein